jgi:hypothetical protein
MRLDEGGAMMPIAVKLHRFTVEQYHRMGEAGILDEDVELLGGQVVVREPIGAYHAGTVNRLTRLWTSRLGDRAVVQVQNPIELATQDSEPQPDISVLRPRADFYTASHPVASDVLLVIEVADTTLRLDRRVKLPLYARAGIREAWVVDLAATRVEIHRQPTARGYGEVRVLARDGSVVPVAFPDLTIHLADVLG